MINHFQTFTLTRLSLSLSNFAINFKVRPYTWGAAAAAATLDTVKRELGWECPERMFEQVSRDDLFAYHRCTVFMYAGIEPGFELQLASQPQVPAATACCCRYSYF